MKNGFFVQRYLRLLVSVTTNIFIMISVSAQDISSPTSDLTADFFSPQNIGLSSPQVADFSKYGNLNINQFNGLLDMSVPLPGYKDRDFDLPMSIKYVSSGFIPSKRPSPVGLNWFLNFGGVVSRKVNGSPDDVKGCYTDSDEKKYIKDGLWAAIQTSKFDYYDQNSLLDFNVSKNAFRHGTPYLEGDVKYDLEPDIFTFNVGKHTGSFIIDNQGKPKLLSGDSLYKIDLKGLTVQEYSTTEAPVSSVIKITAPDGYIYEFGGHLSSLEYFIPNNPKDIDIRPRYITSWHLSSIHAPNQRRIDFGYNSINQPYRYNYFSYYSCIGNAFTTYSTGQVSSNGFGYEDPKRFEMKDDIYVPILRQISIGGEIVILFTMSDRNKFYDDADLPSKGYDKIQYYWNGQEIKSVNFTYVDKDGYFFLESVTDSEQGKYTFQYYHPSTLPSPLTVTTDHWGFWKGNNITHMNRAEIANWSRHVAENREVDTSYCRTNLLKKIVYPTGGFSIVEYEPNARLFGGKPQATAIFDRKGDVEPVRLSLDQRIQYAIEHIQRLCGSDRRRKRRTGVSWSDLRCTRRAGRAYRRTRQIEQNRQRCRLRLFTKESGRRIGTIEEKPGRKAKNYDICRRCRTAFSLEGRFYPKNGREGYYGLFPGVGQRTYLRYDIHRSPCGDRTQRLPSRKGIFVQCLRRVVQRSESRSQGHRRQDGRWTTTICRKRSKTKTRRQPRSVDRYSTGCYRCAEHFCNGFRKPTHPHRRVGGYARGNYTQKTEKEEAKENLKFNSLSYFLSS